MSTLYSVDSSRVTYKKADEFVTRLIKAGIRAMISDGGVSIYLDNDDQRDVMAVIADELEIQQPYEGRNERDRMFYERHSDLPGAKLNMRPGSKE